MYNTPVQGISADITKKALSLLVDRIKQVEGKIVAVIHDEILVEVPEKYAAEGKNIVKSTMVEAGELFIKRVPIIVETTITSNWAGK